MGVITDTGRNLRANFLVRQPLWLILGRPDYDSGDPETNPWDAEDDPPGEDTSIAFPDVDLGAGISGIGYKLKETAVVVTPDDNGVLFVNNQRWTITQEQTAPYLYVSFLVSDNLFQTPIDGFGTLLGYRRATVAYGVVPPPGEVDSFRYGQLATTTFASSIPYVEHQIVLPTVSNGHAYAVTIGGTSGAEPTYWPTTKGVTVTSGGVTFTEHSDKVDITDRRGLSFYTKNFVKVTRLFSGSPSTSSKRQLIELILLA